MIKVKGSKFSLGQIVSTPGALAMAESGVNLASYLMRHSSGDWGDMSATDKKENNLSVREGYRIFSSYKTEQGKLWIITEADRSATTFLLPEDY